MLLAIPVASSLATTVRALQTPATEDGAARNVTTISVLNVSKLQHPIPIARTDITLSGLLTVQASLEVFSLATTARTPVHLKLDVGHAKTVDMIFAQPVVNLQCLIISVRKDIQWSGARLLQITPVEYSRVMGARVQATAVREDGLVESAGMISAPIVALQKLFPTTRSAIRNIHWLGVMILVNIRAVYFLVMAARALLKQAKEDGHVTSVNTMSVKNVNQENPIQNARTIIL
jgi:hypothetical protein